MALQRGQPGNLVPGLSDREALVLRHVIHQFVTSATPVGSRTLSRVPEIDLSPATIRNAMSDLEERGILAHPHTSAGRIPTDYGYRLYVNYLMGQEQITASEQELIQSNVDELMPDVEAILARTASLLSGISHNLGVVLAPVFEEGVLERIDLVPLGGNRLLVVVTVNSGLARTVTLEMSTRIPLEVLPKIQRVIQQRLAGSTLRSIRETIRERLANLHDSEGDIARLFIDSTARLFQPVVGARDIYLDGARNLPDIPEFKEDNFRSILEIYEDHDMVLHLLNQPVGDELGVLIGRETSQERAADVSLVTAAYHVGRLPGVLGVIGPRRMNYSRLIHLVQYTAELINNKFSQKQQGDHDQ